ncbi:MAG: site-specific integrase [Planctomycetota bacterium]
MPLFLGWADNYYRKPTGKETREATNLLHATRPLLSVLASREIDAVTASDVEAVRQFMIDSDLARNTINARMGRVRRFIRWAISNKHAKPESILIWESIAPLKYGRSPARETRPVTSADVGAFNATLPYLPDMVRSMVMLQLATGMRSGELCSIRWDLIDRRDDVWIYIPAEHKTEHHGHDRNIAILPPAQELLGEPDKVGYVYVHGRGGIYTPDSYRRVITRAIEKADCAYWTPHQLRHSAITDWATKGGVEVARLLAGHASTRMTSRYIDITADRVIWAARQVATG